LAVLIEARSRVAPVLEEADPLLRKDNNFKKRKVQF
jgi:hypothetical protein